jgi:hypothetical protein
MAGRPRKPSNVLELKGAFKKDPSRGVARANEPVALKEIGDAPAHLSPEVAACWVEIVGLAHKGVLCEVDRLIVEHTAHMLAHLRVMDWRAHPSILIRFEACLGKLGMTPSDRSKVSAIKKDEQKNPYAEFG